MSDALTAHLQEAARHVARLRRTAAAEAAMPERVDGTDGSGTVRVVLDPAGIPESIGVAQDWQRTRGSESIGAAVVEACQAAVDRRTEFWTEALRRHAGLDSDLHNAEAVDPEAEQLLDEVATAVERIPRGGSRSVERVLAELAEVIPDPPPAGRAAPVEGSGVTGFGKVTLTLRPDGTASCQVDPHWAADVPADELTGALNRVLASARAELAGNMAAPVSGRRLEELTAEMLATLRDLT